ncbi:dystrophin-like protein, partial [Leptotrombidium deliense]
EEISAHHHSPDEKDAQSPIRPQPKLLDAIDVLDSWLSKAKNLVLNHRLDFSAGNYDALEENLKQFRDLEKDMLEKDNYNYITNSVQELLNSTPVAPWKSSIEKKLQNLKENWIETNSMLKSRIEKLEKLQQTLPQLYDDLSQLSNWLRDANAFLNSDIAFGDTNALETQIQQCNSVLSNCEQTYKNNLNSVNKKGNEIIAEIDSFVSEECKKQLESRLRELNSNWNGLQQTAKHRRQLLEETLRKSEDIAEVIREMESSIISIEREFDEIGIASMSDLKAQESVLRTFADKIKFKGKQIEELKSVIRINSSQKSSSSLADMNQRVALIEGNLKTLRDKVEDALRVNKQNAVKYREFNHLLNLEKDWLDKLERKMKRSPQSAADAEEISDSLDDLENFLRHRPVDRCERLKALGDELIAATVFADTVKQNLEFITNRWLNLSRQAKSMQNELEATMSEAQQCERQVLSVHSGLNQIDSKVQVLLDGVEEPEASKEMEQIEVEYKNQEEALNALRSCVERYRLQERHEAASRLEEQLKLLNVSEYRETFLPSLLAHIFCKP